MKNNKLNSARKNKNDEFYTLYEDIEKEISHYKDQFKDKIVYCNCDDYHKSNFTKFFIDNFKSLNIKKLYSTGYNKDSKGFYFEYDGKSKIEKELEGDGDFQSAECLDILEKSDIVVTNPPFSLFRKYIDLLMDYNKKFLVLGTTGAVGYQNIFHYLMNGNLWLGYHTNITLTFQLPDDYEKWQKIVDGKKLGKVPSISWYTNLETNKIIDAPMLLKKYDKDEYIKFDNYDAINVDKVKEIPYDYDGYIGVPVTICGLICSDGLIHLTGPSGEDIKYKILGHGNGHLFNELPGNPTGLSEEFVKRYHEVYHKTNCVFKPGHTTLCYYDKAGCPMVPYTRWIIQKKTK